MKPFAHILAVTALAATLAACGKKSAEPTPATPAAEAAAPASSDPMAGMDMAGAKMAMGSGTVTAIDKTAGTITLDHGPIAAIQWPAMSMEFKASPASLLETVKVGDKVSFDLKMAAGTGEVTAIRPQ